ncbi:ATP-binding cassette transporter YOR1 [Lachancea thermotolerans CBS 6340]|uniref:KLTH0B09724p n=1 Tax=Lachancea thermotolerans (strain ATCC 56472 / CBS 6340 / NRRL Y-8284) TaxID=559295 RepID=C5DDB0_LACTC|nr:KLTH0B09724p [Lachancea thermotolerans CBS 6340]CAR21771.1 KLTH0B09724p [Lachancea thermotolerans CBS 6340]
MISSTSTSSDSGSEKDHVISIHAHNAPQARKLAAETGAGAGDTAGVGAAIDAGVAAEAADASSVASSTVDQNRPETFLNSDDLERVTDSEIYPQKRLFSLLHTRKIPQIPLPEERKTYPLYHTNPIYYAFFWWVFPIIRIGYKRTLQPNDLWAMDNRISIEAIYATFTKYMDHYTEIARQNYAQEHPEASPEDVRENTTLSKHALFKALLRTFKLQYFFALIAMSLSNATSAFIPMVTKRLIRFVEEKALVPGLKVNAGVGYAIGASIMMLLNAILLNHSFHLAQLTGVQVKSILIKAILNKSFKLSGYSKHKFPNGKITSVMSTDLSRLELAIMFQPLLGAFFVAVIICIVQLIVNLGPVALVGVGIFAAAMVGSAYAFKRMINVRKTTNQFTDARVTLMREIMNSMKMIKFYAWEDAYEKNVNDVRTLEIRQTRIMQFTRNFVTALAVCLPSLASMVTFLVMYKVNNNGRNPADIFSSLSLFQVLSIQMFFLPMALGTGVDGSIALNRVQEILEAGEEDQDIEKTCLPMDDEKHALKLVNASFQWENFEVEEAKDVAKAKQAEDDKKNRKDKKHNAHEVKTNDSDSTADSKKAPNVTFKGFDNLNIQITKGELVIVTGSVGTGKSSLLYALSGFMKKTGGDIYKDGTMLLCGYPWIQNATVRDNILFGSPYNEARYNEIIRVCSLQADLELLPAGDRTEIGERGITLSGGQKARINLARAVYKKKDIYLFDDVLSAVDARVGKHIMDECLMGKLEGSTRVLATHQLSLIARASKVIYIDLDGSVDVGSVEELKKRKPGFVNLMQYSNHSESEKKPGEVEEEKRQEAGAGAQPVRPEIDSRQSELEASELKKQVSKRSQLQDEQKGVAPDGRLTSKEERAVNSISYKVYQQYITAGVGKKGFLMLPIYLMLLAVSTFSLLFSSVWLSFWTENKFKHKKTPFYMGMYTFFVFFNYFVTTSQFSLICYIGLSAAKRLNLKAVQRLLHTPMSFLDTTPIGRVLNRFTKDTDTVDTELTESVRLFVFQLSNIVGVIVMCIIYLPWFAIAVPFLMLVFVGVADHYQSSSREIKRLEAVQRSHVFNNFNEVLGGMDTIRAYRGERRFLTKSDFLTNKMNEAGYLVVAIQRWVAIALDMIAMAFALIVTLLCVTRQFHISAASVGVLLTYVLQLPGLLNMLLRAMTQGENDMNSTERLISYATELPLEAAYRRPEMSPPAEWPTDGRIEFDHVSLAYRPGLPLVLKDVTLHVAAGEKIGICGRTGAGKSTIMSALYRMCELHDGSITIDGVDISTLGLYDLRSKLSIIPQDPVMFKGDVRKNLDPFHERTDDELWHALVRGGAIPAESLATVRAQTHENAGSLSNMHKFHLQQEVEEDGTNFSLGERQLLALTRALVRQSKILILDEATSSVDYETDAKIQTRIVEAFSNCTILCIAHRLNTILDYDRILVLDQGRVCEFDTPAALYARGGVFTEMCDRSGITRDDFNTRHH